MVTPWVDGVKWRTFIAFFGHAPIVLLFFFNIGYLPRHVLLSVRAVAGTPALQCHVRTYSSGINSPLPTTRGRTAMWRVVWAVTMLGLRRTMARPCELHACSHCVFSYCSASVALVICWIIFAKHLILQRKIPRHPLRRSPLSASAACGRVCL